MNTRYSITFTNSQGLRVHYAGNQARNFFDTGAQAAQRLKDIHANNSQDTIKSIFGENPRFEVTPVECHLNGDAVRSVF
jgi:hypothetical protein